MWPVVCLQARVTHTNLSTPARYNSPSHNALQGDNKGENTQNKVLMIKILIINFLL